MTRTRASLILFALWAAIYLPGLGSTEIKGEEGRRILPAVTMLETGNWLVPYVGGKPFLRKPPGINWAIALSFKLTGVQNEWTARLPSALAVLALGLTIVALATGRGWMDAETGLVAALMAMTPLGLLAKARFAGAEIEGLYVPLAGIATVCWMAWWTQRRSPWLTWVVPWVVLGVAMLVKGPLHLLFFYAVVLAVLWKGGALREFARPAHLAGIALMCAIFAGWAVPYFQTEAAGKAGKVWKDQLANRVTENAWDWQSYALNLPRGLADALPWVLFAPAVIASARRRRVANGEGSAPANANGTERIDAVARGTLLASAACFLLLLIPGVLPRYVLPLTTIWALLVALALSHSSLPEATARWSRAVRLIAWLLVPIAIVAPLGAGASGGGLGNMSAFHWPRAFGAAAASSAVLLVAAMLLSRREDRRVAPLAIRSAMALGALALLYATAVVPWLNHRDLARPLAAEIDAAIPAAKTLVLFDPGYMDALFYLRTPYEYASVREEIPAHAEFILVRGAQREKFAEKRPDLAVTRTFATKDHRELLLLQPRAAVREDARPLPEKTVAPR